MKVAFLSSVWLLVTVATSMGMMACASAAPATAGDGDLDASSPCQLTDAGAICRGPSVGVTGGDADTRAVFWAKPAEAAPTTGWPGVILYQGTGIGPKETWNVDVPSSAPYGGYYQLVVIATLLEHGFVVIQPEAQNGLAWDTNNPLAPDYDASADAVFIPRLLAAIARGAFGLVDMARLYATGISSGGYMTSRMAVSYPGKFRALAIESGSYATCLGPLCTLPSTLPADHPPTLFLHGSMDDIVPIATAQAYEQALMAQGTPTEFVEDPDAGHQWIPAAPAQVAKWFEAH
jgi:dienelactone hydrolase